MTPNYGDYRVETQLADGRWVTSTSRSLLAQAREAARKKQRAYPDAQIRIGEYRRQSNGSVLYQVWAFQP